MNKRDLIKKAALLCGALLLSQSLSTVASAQKVKFEIVTSKGTLKGFLYDDVPNHARTFAKYAEAGDYDGTLFARVVPGFVIQGGSADSRGAAPGAVIGSGDPSKEILPESSKTHFYKRGALCAPRQDIKINPKGKSDMSQFFIVDGDIYSPGKLDTMRLAINMPIRKAAMDKYYRSVLPELKKLKKSDPRAYNARAKKIIAQIDSAMINNPKYFKFTDEQRKAYTTIGGIPRYEGEYTIYGEITDGLDIIDKIAHASHDKNNRPKSDIKIIKVRIIK